MPQVSVVIPVYNIEAHLRQCLDSVAGQTLSDLEVVCVDDGSTDASPAILEEYAQKDPRFQVIRQANAGPGAARNRGMERSSGRYLIFLDSDDWFEPDFLERMTARAEETGADVTICRADEFDTHSGQVYDGSWMLKTQLLPGAVFSPREAAGAVFQFTYGWPWDKLYRRDYILKEKFRSSSPACSAPGASLFWTGCSSTTGSTGSRRCPTPDISIRMFPAALCSFFIKNCNSGAFLTLMNRVFSLGLWIFWSGMPQIWAIKAPKDSICTI